MGSSDTNKLQIFVSSPGDVRPEREISKQVIDRLQGKFAALFEVQAILWEDLPIHAAITFQGQIVRPSETDIVVCILWSKLGTPLPEEFRRSDGSRYSSGTEFEYEDARAGFDEKQKPDILVYKRTSVPEIKLNDHNLAERQAQYQAVQDFFQKWFYNPDGSCKGGFKTYETVADFERTLDADLQALLQKRLADGQGTGNPKVRWTEGSPFRGLNAFDVPHADIFYGRTREIADIREALVRRSADGCAFVLILGMSGCGKSSVMRAGVLPTITRPGVVEGAGLWRWCQFRPSDAPLDFCKGLAAAIVADGALPELRAAGVDVEKLAPILTTTPEAAGVPIGMALAKAADEASRQTHSTYRGKLRLVVMIDQLDELFTLDGVSDGQRQAFVRALAALARSGDVWVIATMRSDFYHRCADLPDLVRLKEGIGQYDLLPPGFDEIGQMIVYPAQAAGVRFERDPRSGRRLDEVLHEAAGRMPESLPLLSFTLNELYQARESGRLLTFAAYHTLGGIEGAICKRAEEVVEKQSSKVQESLRSLIRRLATVEGATVVSRRVSTRELAANADRKTMLEALIDARLLVADRAQSGEPVARVAHEALLEHWPRVKQWLMEDMEFLRVRARIAERATWWRDNGRRSDYLLPAGKLLKEAKGLVAKYGEYLDADSSEYVTASVRYHRRRHVVVTGLVALVVLAGLSMSWYFNEQKQAARAADLVERLLDADSPQVLPIIEKMQPYWRWAEPLLRQNYADASTGQQQSTSQNGEIDSARGAIDYARRRLRASLGLLSGDSGQVDYLYTQLFEANPRDVLVIREALDGHKERLIERLWTDVQHPPRVDSARLRAASALAAYNSQSNRWSLINQSVAAEMVAVSPEFLGLWMFALRPVHAKLLDPLASVYRDPNPNRDAERYLATSILAHYAGDNPDFLVKLLLDSDEKQFPVLFLSLKNIESRVVPQMEAVLRTPLAPQVTEEDKERLVKQQANAAVALLKLGRTNFVWPNFQHSPVPSLRGYLVRRVASLGVEAAPLIQQLNLDQKTPSSSRPSVGTSRSEQILFSPEKSSRRALLLALGGYTLSQFTPSEQKSLLQPLFDLYRDETDPGLHGAAEMLLRKWGHQNELTAIDKKLSTGKREGDRTWFLRRDGECMVVIPGPVEFTMGSPTTEAEREGGPDGTTEKQRRKRINRTFAIASKKVTVDQFLRSKKDHLYDKKQGPKGDCPVTGVTWFKSVEYCNWMSCHEKIPKSQWCYLPNSKGEYAEGMKLAPGYLSLQGYRLPTEPEWEYACRAGAITARYYGEGAELLVDYAWYTKNSRDVDMLSVGHLKPNDFGLFDILGNAWEWTMRKVPAESLFVEDPPGDDVEDADDLKSVGQLRRITKGASFLSASNNVRASQRNWIPPSAVSKISGFRLAKTMSTP